MIVYEARWVFLLRMLSIDCFHNPVVSWIFLHVPVARCYCVFDISKEFVDGGLGLGATAKAQGFPFCVIRFAFFPACVVPAVKVSYLNLVEHG